MAFKKGDRVRYVGDDTPDLLWQVGTVSDTETYDDESVCVEWDSGITHTTSVFARNVELITTAPVEIEVGKEYRLLPNARRAAAPTIFNSDVTRVRVLSGEDSEGDYYVESLNGIDNDANRKVGVGHYAYILPEFLAPLEEDSPADNTVSADEAATVELLAEIKQLQQQLANAKALHESDVQTIGQALIEAANGDNYRSGSRWCSEYDDAIEEVNHNLAVKLPLREQEWDVEIYFSSYTVQVTAPTAEEAEAEARRQFAGGHIEPDISYTEAERA